MTADCSTFTEHLEELALGSLDEPARTELLQHAAVCSRCRIRLDQLTWVTEQVLVTAPEIEPPAGFEDRVLAGINASASAGRHPKRPRWHWVAAAAAVIVFAVGGLALGRQQQDSSPAWAQAVRSGVIRRSDGSLAGAVVLARTPRPHVLVTMDQPRPSNNVVQCVLVGADGSRTAVGSWSYSDIEKGAWAAGIDASLLGASRMEVINSDGVVVASATLS